MRPHKFFYLFSLVFSGPSAGNPASRLDCVARTPHDPVGVETNGGAQVNGLFGSSALADFPELRRAGFLGANGVRLGAMSERNWLGRETTHKLRYSGDHHHLIVAGSGGGKFVSSLGLVLWDFLSQPTGSCVVVDPKGEALHKIGKLAMRPFNLHDEDKDFFVCWLDPWNLSGTGHTWSYNFLNRLRLDDPNLADDARALAEAIIIQRNTAESHWEESAKIFLTAVLIYVAVYPAERRRDLCRVAEILMLPWNASEKESLSGIMRAMADMDDPSTVANGIGAQYLDMPEKERESIFSAVRRDTVWIKSIPMSRVLKEGTLPLNFDHVATGRYLLFLVLPFERIRTHRAWLRLLITALANAFRRIPPRDASFASRRHVFVDEWPRLGRLEVLQDEIAIARGAGVQYHLYCQSLGQIEDNYRKGWQDFVANSVVQAFAVQDKMTSDYLSSISGTQTVQAPGSSFSIDTSWKRSRAENINLKGRPVLMPDEIRRLGGSQLVLARGLNPILADMEYVYKAPDYAKADHFNLTDILETIGDEPRSAAELARYMWRDCRP